MYTHLSYEFFLNLILVMKVLNLLYQHRRNCFRLQIDLFKQAYQVLFSLFSQPIGCLMYIFSKSLHLGRLSLHLLNPIKLNSQGQQDPHRYVLHNKKKYFSIINSFSLSVVFGNEPGFISSFQNSQDTFLDFINSFITDRFTTFGSWDQLPSVIHLKRIHLFIHGLDPSFRFPFFFQLSRRCNSLNLI